MAAELSGNFFEFFVPLAKIARRPVHIAQAVENRALDTVLRVALKGNLLVVVILQGSIEKPHDSRVRQIVQIHVDRKVFINAHGDSTHERQVFQDQTIALGLRLSGRSEGGGGCSGGESHFGLGRTDKSTATTKRGF